MKRRVVAIVGRPNVGKSAMFNRIVGARVAIVHEECGVTRDRIMMPARMGEQRFDLIDTGGIVNIDKAVLRGTIEAGVRRQAEIAIRDAAVVVLMVDVRAGLVPLDEEVAGILRSSGATAFVAANKADDPSMDADASDFERFGFPVFPVSALHYRGIDALMTAVTGALPDAKNETVANPLKVAVIGRPNVGKSSYINKLLGDERVVVSESAGTTRDSVEIPFAVGSGPAARHYVLIDTAGIRHKSRIGSAVEYFSAIRTEQSMAKADIVVVVTDGSQGSTSQDKAIAAKACENAKGCVVLVNKWDLVKEKQSKFEEEFRWVFSGISHLPIVFVSAKTGYNVRRTVEAIDRVAEQLTARLPTGVLNRAVTDAFERVQPPLVAGRRLKVYYAVQVGCQPIRIRLFVNSPTRMTPSYKAYLIRVIREAFGLDWVTVVLGVQSRPREKGRDTEGGDSHDGRHAHAADGEARPSQQRQACRDAANRRRRAGRNASNRRSQRSAGRGRK